MAFHDDPDPEEDVDPDVAAFVQQATGESDMGGAMMAGVLDDEPPPEDLVEKAPIWLVTFGDVTALMLAFFVMLYSMSYLQSEKWDEIISILATRPQPEEEGKPQPTADRSITRIEFVSAFSTGYLERILSQKLAADPVLQTIRLTGLEDQLVLSLQADDLFDGRGSTALTAQAEIVLARLYTVFTQFGNRIDVHAHTDPTAPSAGSVYADNWTLSLGQGLTIAQRLNELGYEGDFTVMALADSRYRYIDSNIPEAERFALARRIDLVISPEARGQ